MTDTSSPSATEVVLAERRGSVLVLTLNRPDRLNAWTEALEDRYFDLLLDADDDPEVRAIVVTGAGRGFCAGADMDALAKIGQAGAEFRHRERPRHLPRTIRKPLIAAINGAAAGLGLVEALYCDMRFCVPDAKLTTAFARRGLIAEYGISWLLPRLVGTSRAFDLLASARVARGDEALVIGLVDRLSEPGHVVDDAVAYATDIAENCSPASMAVIKAQLQRHVAMAFEDAVEDSNALMLEAFGRPDPVEGVASYLERRPPAFPALSPGR